jgi:hypothetical protein
MSEATSSRHSGEERTKDDVVQLRDLASGNTPVGVMSARLGRTEDAIRSRAEAEGHRVVATDRSPYGDIS